MLGYLRSFAIDPTDFDYRYRYRPGIFGFELKCVVTKVSHQTLDQILSHHW